MSAPKVSVVVLNWNDGAATAACLRALAAADYPDLSVIVVDNASTDGSAEQFSAAAGVELIRNDHNLGFTGGVNSGIRRAVENGADYVWIVNNDATAAPDVPSKLVAAAERDPRIGLVSPVFCNPDPPHAAEVCLARFDPRSRLAAQTDDPATALDWSERHPDQIVLLGTALLIRRGLIEKIGGLDDRFFAYVEDVDYSLRSIAAGFRNVAVPDAVVGHRFKRPVEQPGDVPPHLHYFISRNYPLLWRKLPGRAVLSKSMLWFVRDRLLQITRMRRDTVAVDAVLAGLWDGWRGVGGPYDPARRMPAPFRPLLARYPEICLALLDGRMRPEKTAR